MPIYDYVCECGAKKKDEFAREWNSVVLCICGLAMKKVPSRFYADVFPSDGIFLEHVSASGKLFHSKKEMRDYAKQNDIELNAL